MSIEELIDAMKLKLTEWSEPQPGPCTELEILSAETIFFKAFGHRFPDAYKRILRATNGFYFDGMTIWPIKPEPGFEETISQANQNLNEYFSRDFVYFGQNGEELYVLNLKTSHYCAIEFVGKPVWREFADAEEMYRFMLERNFLAGQG